MYRRGQIVKYTYTLIQLAPNVHGFRYVLYNDFTPGTVPKQLLEERMSLFQILHQTSNENMHKKHSTYTINPKTR